MTPQRYDAWGATEDAAPLWRLALWQSDNGKFPPSMGKHMCVSFVDHLQLNDFSMVYLRLVLNLPFSQNLRQEFRVLNTLRLP